MISSEDMVEEGGLSTSEKSGKYGDRYRHNGWDFNDTYDRDQTLRAHALRIENHDGEYSDVERGILLRSHIFGK